MIDAEAIERFVVANTVVASAPLVPEIALHLATEMTPIWQATERTLQELGVEPPFWAFCWPGSQALARFLLDGGLDVGGRRVLDFACGCGIAAVAAAQGGARATGNDIDRFALVATRMNAALNAAEVTLEGRDLLAVDAEGWEVILAGDVCYERSMAEATTRWLQRAAGRGTTVLLADPGRNYPPGVPMTPLARYVVPTSTDLEDRESRTCTVFRMLPAAEPGRP